jgi:hypothetical protein
LWRRKAEVVVDRKLSREQDAAWLSDLLLRLEKEQIFFPVAEVDGNVIASSDLHLGRGSRSTRVRLA